MWECIYRVRQLLDKTPMEKDYVIMCIFFFKLETWDKIVPRLKSENAIAYENIQDYEQKNGVLILFFFCIYC